MSARKITAATDEVKEELELFSLQAEDSVIAGMVRFAKKNGMDPVEVVGDWISFRENNHNEDMPLNDSTFEAYIKHKSYETQRQSKTKDGNHLNTTPSRVLQSTADNVDLSMYGIVQESITPNTERTKRPASTPENQTNKRLINSSRTPTVTTPKALLKTPKREPPRTSDTPYSKRRTRGDIEQTYGTSFDFTSPHDGGVDIDIHDNILINEEFAYMFQKIYDRVEVIETTIENLCEEIRNFHKEEEPDMKEQTSILQTSESEGYMNGMIMCDCDGKLNAQSVVLQSSISDSAGETVQLNLNNHCRYSVFPGQTLVVKGSNPDGKSIKASKIFTPPALKSSDIRTCDGFTGLVSSGPYIPDKSEDLSPLYDLLDKIDDTRPDVVMLMGPFLDCDNQTILDMQTDYDDKFSDIMLEILNRTVNVYEDMRVIIIPNHTELIHEPIFPTPRYNIQHIIKSYQPLIQSRIHMMGDPCNVTINNVNIGAVSADVIFHMMTNEISWNPGNQNRLSRACEHMLEQRSYFPVITTDTQQQTQINIDPTILNQVRMSDSPHVLITPSTMNTFIKVVGSTVCINPSYLCKGIHGRTYMRFKIDPIREVTNTVKDHIHVQILKI